MYLSGFGHVAAGGHDGGLHLLAAGAQRRLREDQRLRHLGGDVDLLLAPECLVCACMTRQTCPDAGTNAEDAEKMQQHDVRLSVEHQAA